MISKEVKHKRLCPREWTYDGVEYDINDFFDVEIRAYIFDKYLNRKNSSRQLEDDVRKYIREVLIPKSTIKKWLDDNNVSPQTYQIGIPIWFFCAL